MVGAVHRGNEGKEHVQGETGQEHPGHLGKVEFKEIFFKFKGMVESNIKQGSAFVVNHN